MAHDHCNCRNYTRSQLLRQGAAQAGQGLPAVESGMPLPAGTGLTRRSLLLRGTGLALAVYGATRLPLGALQEGVAQAQAPNRVLVSLFFDGGIDSLNVLAPINIADPVWPANPDRDFGPWGLSFASDRWDFRRALVIEATQRDAADASENARQILYVDLQTLQPLFTATFDTKGEMTNVGLFVGRWSETREDYPRWPDDAAREVRVIDSVGAAFANLAESGSWRRESWENVSTPPPDDEIKRMISTNELTKRH